MGEINVKIIWKWFVNEWKRNVFFGRMIIGFIIIAFIWLTAMALGLTRETQESNHSVEEGNLIENNQIEENFNFSDFNQLQ